MKKKILFIMAFVFLFPSALFGDIVKDRIVIKGEIIETENHSVTLKIHDENGKDFNIIVPPNPEFAAGEDDTEEDLFRKAVMAFAKGYKVYCQASGLSAIPYLEVGDLVEISGQLVSGDAVEVCYSDQDYLNIIPFIKEIEVIGRYTQGKGAFTKSWLCHCGITTDDDKYYSTMCISTGSKDRNPQGKRIKAILSKTELGTISGDYMGQMPVGEEFFPRCIGIKEYEILEE